MQEHDALSPATYAIDIEQNQVTMTLRCDLTAEAFARCRDLALADPNYKRGMRWYVDCRVLTSIPTQTETARLAADHVEHRDERGIGRTAIVVLTPTGFLFAQTWLQVNHPPGTFGVFTSQADAKAWLG